MSDYETAVNDIFGQFTAMWAGATAIVGYAPEIRYQGDIDPETPDTSKFFARISTQIVREDTAAINALSVGDAGRLGVGGIPTDGTMLKKYRTDGLVLVQLFGPIAEPDCFQKLRKLATLSANAFRGVCTGSGVWFRAVSRKELSPSDNFQQINVNGQFVFYENA